MCSYDNSRANTSVRRKLTHSAQEQSLRPEKDDMVNTTVCQLWWLMLHDGDDMSQRSCYIYQSTSMTLIICTSSWSKRFTVSTEKPASRDLSMDDEFSQPLMSFIRTNG